MLKSALSHYRAFSPALSQRNSVVSIDIIPKEDRKCMICYDEYGVFEDPFMLCQCKHIFGSRCIKQWFEEGKTTCPMCRDKCIKLLDY
ncbi:hypothetical protein V8C42DRAFT_337827 [Trichoderma barbatum]